MSMSVSCGTPDRRARAAATRQLSDIEQEMDDLIFSSEDEDITPRRAEELAKSAELLRGIAVAKSDRLKSTAQDIVAGHGNVWNKGQDLTKDQAEEYEFLKRDGHSIKYIANHLNIPISRVFKHHHKAMFDRKGESIRQAVEGIDK